MTAIPSGGRGEMGLDPAELGLRAAAVPPPERSAGGGGHPATTRFARRGSTRFHPTDPWNCSAGEDPLPEPSNALLANPSLPRLPAGSTCRLRATLPRDERSSTFGPSLQASRGDPDRRLTARVPPCSRSVQENGTRIAPRFPRPPHARGPRRSQQCRSGPTRAAWRKEEGRTSDQRDGPSSAGPM